MLYALGVVVNELHALKHASRSKFVLTVIGIVVDSADPPHVPYHT